MEICLSYYSQCDPDGRTDDEAQRVLIVHDVKQIGDDPLLVFEGF